MRFHVTITDNETGKTIHDIDACAIIAGIEETKGSVSFVLTNCGGDEMAKAIMSAEKAAKSVLEKHPELEARVMLYKIIGKHEQVENEEADNEE